MTAPRDRSPIDFVMKVMMSVATKATFQTKTLRRASSSAWKY